MLVEKYVELDKLLNLCQSVFPCPYTLPYVSETAIEETVRRKLKIAVARDEAFCFIYYENLKRLGEQGRITFFSPLRDNKLPAADLVYLPGDIPNSMHVVCTTAGKSCSSCVLMRKKGERCMPNVVA